MWATPGQIVKMVFLYIDNMNKNVIYKVYLNFILINRMWSDNIYSEFAAQF